LVRIGLLVSGGAAPSGGGGDAGFDEATACRLLEQPLWLFPWGGGGSITFLLRVVFQ
jgi:hypothetical protein